MKETMNIANVVTASRILFAILILFSPVFSIQFYIFYLLGSFTDMIDGTIARKLNRQSSFGAKLDTIADFVFVVAVMANILPNFYVPKWLWIWITVIFAVKFINLASAIIMFHKLVPMHTIMNKVTGALLFLLPFGIGRGAWQTSAIAVIVVCSIATFAAIQEGHNIRSGKSIE